MLGTGEAEAEDGCGGERGNGDASSGECFPFLLFSNWMLMSRGSVF